MNKEDLHIKNLLKLASISFNTSLLVLISLAIGVIVLSLPKNEGKKIIETSVAQNVDETYGIDSTEIKNGIHVPSGLIADTGFNLVLTNCTRCHAIEVVKQNRATKEGWKNMITWMQKTQGLWDLGKNEEPILEYLSKNYAPTNTGRRKNLENIVWYNLKN